jgi:uroporphyrin-3 C-methyltransferase
MSKKKASGEHGKAQSEVDSAADDDALVDDNAQPDEPADATFAAPADEVSVSARTDDAASAASESRGKKRGSTAGVVAWTALLLSGIALTAYVMDFLAGDDPQPVNAQNAGEIASLSASLRATRDSLTTLEQSVSALSTLDGTRSAELSALQRQFDERIRQLEVLPGRVASIQSNVSSLQGVSTGARDAWLLAEAEYYMQIANAQLQLAGNPHLATLALSMADERILQLADPGLVEVRRALSSELRALESLQRPDTEGITLTLASLASAVDTLPLRHEIVISPATDSAIDPELSGVDRAVASLQNALGGVVSVRRADEALQPLIAPEAQYFLRTNLALQLQAARLAVLRNEETIFAQSLDDAVAWINEYYDTGSAAVVSAQQSIAEIRGGVFSFAAPDISESLRLLRQFNAFSRVASESQQSEPGAAAETGQTEDAAGTDPEPEPQQ